MIFYRIFIAVTLFYIPAVQAAIPESEKKALLAISKFVDDGFLTQEWLKTEANPCQWKGVTCDAKQQHVIKLELPYEEMTELKPQISLLPALEELNLSGNYLTTLPAEIGQLKALTILNLSRNQLKTLPPEIGQLTALKYLNVSYNLLTELPSEIGQLKNLMSLYANSNQVIEISVEIKALPALADLQLNANWRRPEFHADIISEKTAEIAQRIEDKGEIEGEAVGIAAERTEQYDNFVELKNIASQAELLELVNHPSPAVRGYAFWALTEYQEIDLLPIIESHLNDNEKLDTTFACDFRKGRAGDFFIHAATSESRWIRQTSSKKLPDKKIQILDQSLINLPNDLYAQNEVLLRIKPDPALYSKIRQLLIDEDNQAALVAIAKYKKQQDIPLIIKNLTDHQYYRTVRGYFRLHINATYVAVQSFPHPDFFSYLEKDLLPSINGDEYLFYNQLDDLYLTIAHYKDSKATRLLTMPLGHKIDKLKTTEHYQARFCAARQVDMAFYEKLFWSFWENHYVLDNDVFANLLKKDPDRALNLIFHSLKNIEKFFVVNLFLCGDGTNRIQLTNTLVNLAFEKQPELTIELIKEFIETGQDIYQLTALMIKKAGEIKDPSFIAPLFKQLQKIKKYYDYEPVVGALLAYNNEPINQKLKETILKHKHLSEIKEDDQFKTLF